MHNVWRERGADNAHAYKLEMTSRIDDARVYLDELEDSFRRGWWATYRERGSSIFRAVALIHPDHLLEIDGQRDFHADDARCRLQGPRQFSAVGQPAVRGCQSELIWGYCCNLDGGLQQDHLFPYSLGGPTVATNQIGLCRYHNMVKTSDIHCYPWEQVEARMTPWLPGQIEKVRRVFEIYSPGIPT